MAGTSHSLNNLDLDSFSFRWDIGLDCEDEDGSVSDYGTVLYTRGTNLSAPLTTATGLSAVEEITEGGLTGSRTASTAPRLSLSMTPGDNELGLLPSYNRMDHNVIRDSKNLLGRLRLASDRLLSIPWHIHAPTPPAVTIQVGSSEKPSMSLRPRLQNKLRKKTRPSIAITLAVEPASSFSLAQPPPRSLGVSRASGNPVSVSLVAGFPSAKSFLSFQLPPVFSRARFKALQKSSRRPSNGMGVTNRTSTTNRPDPNSSDIRTRKSVGSAPQDVQPTTNCERTGQIDDDGIGGFPTPIRSASHHDQGGGPRERTPTRGRPSRISTSWELGLGHGQDLRMRVCSLWRVRGG